MTVPATRFGEYLAEDESIIHGSPGTLVDERRQSEGTIGVTDRRVVFLSERNRFVDVTHDAISSIHSRERTTFTAGGIGYRLLVGVGALVAALSFLAVVGPGVAGPGFLLASLTVGAAVGAEYVRRNDVDVGWDGLADRLPGADGPLRRPPDAARDRGNGKPLVFGLAYLGLAGLVGLVVVTGSLLVVPLLLLTLGGLAVADGAYRRTRGLDRSGRSRRHEREVTIHLVDGRRVRLRVDGPRRLDRELSGVAREAGRSPPDVELASTTRSRG